MLYADRYLQKHIKTIFSVSELTASFSLLFTPSSRPYLLSLLKARIPVASSQNYPTLSLIIASRLSGTAQENKLLLSHEFVNTLLYTLPSTRHQSAPAFSLLPPHLVSDESGGDGCCRIRWYHQPCAALQQLRQVCASNDSCARIDMPCYPAAAATSSPPSLPLATIGYICNAQVAHATLLTPLTSPLPMTLTSLAAPLSRPLPSAIRSSLPAISCASPAPD